MSHFTLRAAAGALLLSLPARAQTPSAECGLRGADTVIAGVTQKQCLDVTALDKRTLVIPSNVVRIDNQGFALCEKSQEDGGKVDIVYALDQSGSMNIGAVWISLDKRDTVYLQNSNCQGFNRDDIGGIYGNLTIQNETGVGTIPVLNPNKPIGNCATSGDPFKQRGVAFREAIDFQAERAPGSTAGYMGFAGSVINPIRPLPLDNPANVTRLKNAITLRYDNATNYTAPLDSAKRWLLNPAVTTNPNKAIIFLSDGRPTTQANEIFSVIDSNYARQPGKMPPVFGILLSHPTPDTAILDSISRRTGGKFFLIPPSRPDSLKAVVAQILNVILRQYRPAAAVVTNNSIVGAGATAVEPGGFTSQGAGSWLINFDKAVPLNKQADNQIKLETNFKDQTQATQAKTVNFSLTTTGPEESLNRNLPGTPFSIVCRDLPPPVNPVRSAYIKDVNGDGAGDLVVVVFAQPLAALPASLDVYWNNFGPAFKSKAPPALSFLPGSGNTVILANLPVPFPVGLTAQGTAAPPVAVLPAGGVFGGQQPVIKDSIGPILTKATLNPFNPTVVQPNAKVNVDTLRIKVSESLLSGAQWNSLLLWSKSVNNTCQDYETALPVIPDRNPTLNAARDSLIIEVAAGEGPSPSKGDCIYLNANGIYTDTSLNVPPKRGIILEGGERPRMVDVFRGYPPVVGMDANLPGFMATNQDPRKGSEFSSYSVIDPATNRYYVKWIPPVGYVQNQPYQSLIPPIKTPESGTELTPPGALPPGISTVQVVTTAKYIADVSIFDNNGNFVRSFKQAFGFWGEMHNPNRAAPKGQVVSYLVWDLKDWRGQRAGQGVFVWKVLFTFDNGKQEVEYTRTGVVRGAGWFLR